MSDRQLSQKELILRHLREKGPITAMEALRLYGCNRLAARIYDLRQEGIEIERQMIEVESQHLSEPAEVAEYRIPNADPYPNVPF